MGFLSSSRYFSASLIRGILKHDAATIAIIIAIEVYDSSFFSRILTFYSAIVSRMCRSVHLLAQFYVGYKEDNCEMPVELPADTRDSRLRHK